MQRILFFFLFLCSPLAATEFAPWFPPLFEFQGEVATLFFHDHRVETPKGSYHKQSNDYSLHLGLDVTPWPYWNVEGELYLTHTNKVDALGYEAFLFTVRYLWKEDACFNVSTGASFFSVGRRFLRDETFPYHGEINFTLFASIGKEWLFADNGYSRIWGMSGLGQANRGVPWIFGIVNWEFQPTARWIYAVGIDWIFGLGQNDIIPQKPFPGYASIGHRNIDLNVSISRGLKCYPGGFFSFFGWYNLYAQNYVIHQLGGGISLDIPFSF